MRDISTKVDNVGDTLSAPDFNAGQIEVEALVTNANQTLDPAGGPDVNLDQLQKSIAAYSNVGNIYDDSGTGAAYVLSYNLGTLVHVNQYYTNMMIQFKVGNTNTVVAPTVNLNGLGTKTVKRPDGNALVLGDLTIGDTVILKYDGTNFLLLTGFYKASIKSVNGEDIILDPDGAGIVKIVSGDMNLQAGNLVVASGKGIDFDAVVHAGSNSKVLNDYEEGTWIPTNANGLNGTEVGYYIKIGNLVTVKGYVQNNGAGVTNVLFGGLPFANQTGTTVEGIGTVAYQQETAGETWGVTIVSAQETFTFYVASVKKTLSSTNGAYFIIQYFTV